ncbi:MAG: ATP-dependent DNA ligase [Balneolaceae bacterium]
MTLSPAPCTFRRLCDTLQTIRETRGTKAKADIFSSFLQSIEDDESLQLACRFTAEGAFDAVSGKRAAAGSRTTGLAAAAFCEIDYDLVFKPCRIATGSNSEAIEKLMDATPAGRARRHPQPMSLPDMEERFEALRKASSRAEKQQILRDVWKQMTPVEIKFMIRILGQGTLRIGFESRSVVAAIAQAFGRETEAVRYAYMMTGSIGKTALLAKNGELDQAQFQLFHPIAFMLASPIESRSIDHLSDYVTEEKFDGMRAQVHVQGDAVKIFSRDLNDMTGSFPDVASFFAERNLPRAVFDGELVAWRDQTIHSFQELQKRMGLKKPGTKRLAETPVLFIAYDLLYWDGRPLFGHPLSSRRSTLEQAAQSYRLPLSTQHSVTDFEELDTRFRQALEHGNEGLMLKQADSLYEYGQRKKSWLKVKKPGGTLDTVIMYAHAGSGKRGGTYSDFTLGISVKEDERYEEEFIPIGKAYGGYTDEELREMNKKIKELTVETYGPTLGLIPELMVEIEFDEIQVNKRTKAGYTLRFPRFKAIRWDLSPDDADTLLDVETLYRQKMEQKRLPHDQNPSFTFVDGAANR